MTADPNCAAPLLLTQDQAAKALTITTRTLRTMTNAGQIPCVRIGRLPRYDLYDLKRWIEAKKQSGPPQQIDN